MEQKTSETKSVFGTGLKRHQVSLKNRERLLVEGVVNVENFDSGQILLETEGGMLVIKGQGLHVRELNVEASTLSVEGFVRSLEYSDEGPASKRKGLLGRLFR